MIGDRAPDVMAAVLAASGTSHLVQPKVWEPMIPRWLPAPTAVNYAAGVAELVCAYGLFRRTRWAATASVATLAAVYVANVQMAIDAGSGRHSGVMDSKAFTYARLPLQFPMAWAALRARHESPRRLGRTTRSPARQR
jgi:uncharacterized membrane protein